jgi:DNA-binding FrmR family transcriptional regulator
MDTELDKRINRLVGQIQGIRKMIHEERDGAAIAQQIIAAREALSKLGLLVLKTELTKENGVDSAKVEKILKSVFGI